MVSAPLAVAFGETLPQEDEEHETLQITPLLATSFVTAALNCALAPTFTVAAPGMTETVTTGTVTVAEAVFVPSLTEVAVSVTVKGLGGGDAGAL